MANKSGGTGTRTQKNELKAEGQRTVKTVKKGAHAANGAQKAQWVVMSIVSQDT